MHKIFGQMPLRYDLEQALDLLYSSTGYQKFDKYRRKLMRVAIKIQHRLDHQLIFGLPKTNYKYAKSLIFLLDINCFNSVSCVEQGISFNYNYHPDDIFFHGEYNLLRFTIPAQANFFISRLKFPSVVHIKGDLANKFPHHSLIALGETRDGKDIVIWEKRNKDFPYRVTTLSKVFDGYPNCFWAVRPLHTPR